MKKPTALALILAVPLAACGGGDQDESTPDARICETVSQNQASGDVPLVSALADAFRRAADSGAPINDDGLESMLGNIADAAARAKSMCGGG